MAWQQPGQIWSNNDSQRYRHSEAQAKKRIKAREQARKTAQAQAETQPF